MNLRNLLEEKVGADAAGRVMADIDFAYKNGKRGEALTRHFETSLAQEGQVLNSDANSVTFAFVRSN